MEFRFNVNEIFKQPIVQVGPTLIPQGFKGDRRTLWDAVGKVTDVVNAMGTASAAAQGLTKPITSADRLRNSENQQLYLLIDPSAHNGKGAVTGLLKTGQKGLYVFDRDGHHYHVQSPCVLDFYVHESRQRSGYGKTLFEHMLQKEGVVPEKLAIDRPSEKFLEFLKKHYDLQSPIRQMNNYVVYDGFFPEVKDADQQQPPTNNNSTSPNKNMRGSNGLQQQIVTSPYGRYGAPRPACSMGQIIHNQSAAVSPQEPTGLNIRVEEPRTFHRGRSLANATSKQESGDNRQEKLPSVCSKVATVGNGLGDKGQIAIAREQQQTTQQQKQEYYWPFAKPAEEYPAIDKQKLKEKPCCDTIHELISLQCTHKQPEKPQKIAIDDRGHPVRERPIRHRAKTAHVLNSTLHSSSKRLQSNDLLGDVDKELLKMNTFNRKWTEPLPHAQEEEHYTVESEQKPVASPAVAQPQHSHSQSTHQHSINNSHPQYYYHNGQYYVYQPQQHHQGYAQHPHYPATTTNSGSFPQMQEQNVVDANREYLTQQQQMQQQQLLQQQMQQQQLQQQQIQQQQLQQQQLQQQQVQQQHIQQQQLQQQQLQQQQIQQQQMQQRQYQEQMQLQAQKRQEQEYQNQQQFNQSQQYLNQSQPQLLQAQQSSVYSNSSIENNNYDNVKVVEEVGQGDKAATDKNQVVLNNEEAMANRQHALSSQQAFPNQQVYSSTPQLEQTLPCQQLPHGNNQPVHVQQRQTYPQSCVNPQTMIAQQQLVSNSQMPLNAQMFYNQQTAPQQVMYNQQNGTSTSLNSVSSQKLAQKSPSKSQIFINPTEPRQNLTTSDLQAQHMENVIQQETEAVPQQILSNQQEQLQISQMPGQVDNQIESSQRVTTEELAYNQQNVQPKTLSGLQNIDESFGNGTAIRAPQIVAAAPQNMTINPQYPQQITNQQAYVPQTQNTPQTLTHSPVYTTPPQHLANIQNCQQQMACNPQTQPMWTNHHQQQQPCGYQYNNLQPQNVNYYQPQMQSTAALTVQENQQIPQNVYYYQQDQTKSQTVQQIPNSVKEPLEPLIPAVPPQKNYESPKVPQIRAQKIVCPPDNSQMLISSTTRPKESSRIAQQDDRIEKIEKKTMPTSVNPLQRNISSAMGRRKPAGSFVDKSIVIETCANHKSKLNLPNATGDTLKSETEVSQSPPPPPPPVVVQQPKLDRPQTLSLQTSIDQITNEPDSAIGIDSSGHNNELDNMENDLEKVEISENTEGAARKTPSHLTEQGFFDLKFYHNKLW